MRRIESGLPSFRIIAHIAVLAAAILLSGSAAAETETCRSWRAEHADHKARVLGLHLRGASQALIDGAMFDLL